MSAPVRVGPHSAPGRNGGPSSSANESWAVGCFEIRKTGSTRKSLTPGCLLMKAAGARGSEATDTPVRLRRLVGRLHLGADFEQACASIFADTSVTMPQKPPDGVDVPGTSYDRQHLYRSTDVVHLRVDK